MADWFLSHEILSFETDFREDQEKCLIWENLILIKADSPEEAYEKAMRRGKLHEEPFKIDGKSGRCVFLGLRELVAIYDKLEDGAELEWEEFEVDWEKVDALVTPRDELQAFAPLIGSNDSVE